MPGAPAKGACFPLTARVILYYPPPITVSVLAGQFIRFPAHFYGTWAAPTSNHSTGQARSALVPVSASHTYFSPLPHDPLQPRPIELPYSSSAPPLLYVAITHRLGILSVESPRVRLRGCFVKRVCGQMRTCPLYFCLAHNLHHTLNLVCYPTHARRLSLLMGSVYVREEWSVRSVVAAKRQRKCRISTEPSTACATVRTLPAGLCSCSPPLGHWSGRLAGKWAERSRS